MQGRKKSSLPLSLHAAQETLPEKGEGNETGLRKLNTTTLRPQNERTLFPLSLEKEERRGLPWDGLWK